MELQAARLLLGGLYPNNLLCSSDTEVIAALVLGGLASGFPGD